MSTSTRARRGGEIGRNGEWYDGGQFLPSTMLGKMPRRHLRTGPRKAEVAPYEWAEVPDGMVSIYATIAAMVNAHTGEVLTQACTYYRRDPGAVRNLYRRWLDGERWIPAPEAA